MIFFLSKKFSEEELDNVLTKLHILERILTVSVFRPVTMNCYYVKCFEITTDKTWDCNRYKI